MSKFACITRLAHSIPVFVRKRSLKEKTLGGCWTIYQWYKLYGDGEMLCLCMFRKKLLYCVGRQRKPTSVIYYQSWRWVAILKSSCAERHSFISFWRQRPVESLWYFQVDTELRFNISVTSALLKLSVSLKVGLIFEVPSKLCKRNWKTEVSLYENPSSHEIFPVHNTSENLKT